MKKLFLTVMLASLTSISVFAAPSTTGSINKDFKAVPKSQFKTFADVKAWTENWYKENPAKMPKEGKLYYAAVQLAYNNLAGRSDMYDDCMTELTNVYNTTNKTSYATIAYLYKQASVIIRLSGTKLTHEQKFTKLVEIENELYKFGSGNQNNERIRLINKLMDYDSDIAKEIKIKVYTKLWEKYYIKLADNDQKWKGCLSKLGLKLKSLGVNIQ